MTYVNGAIGLLQVGKLIIKMAVLPKLIYRFNVISIKISVGIFVDIDKMFLTIIWKFKGPRIDKTILEGQKREQYWITYTTNS